METYDDLARPATIQYPSANDNIATAFSSEDDLVTMTSNFAAAANDVSYTNSFTPAHQWASAGISNAAFRYAPTQTGSDVYGAVNALNQYAAMTPNGAGTQSLSYDTRGNLTGDGVLTLAYDPENRLVTASKTGMSATYAYDPSGRRKTKIVNGTTTNFIHDGETEIGDYDAAGNVLRRYVPGPAIDHPIAMVTAAGVKTLFHTDKMGSVVAMSNATNGQLAEGPYTYDSWGNCFSGSAPCSAGVPFRYTGQRLDPETGLYHYRARCYSAALGRFCQTDPVGYKDDYNLYTYTHNDPTDLTDPSGTRARVMIDGAHCVVRVIVPVTMMNGPSENKVKAAIKRLTQIVKDQKGRSWSVNFEAVSGRLTDADGISYSNVYSHDGSGQLDNTGGRMGEQGKTYGRKLPAGTHVEFSANPEDKTIRHELGGHGSGLADKYNTVTDEPDPHFNRNLMNNDASKGSQLMWSQVEEVMSAQSGNEVLPNQTERTWGQWLRDNL